MTAQSLSSRGFSRRCMDPRRLAANMLLICDIQFSLSLAGCDYTKAVEA